MQTTILDIVHTHNCDGGCLSYAALYVGLNHQTISCIFTIATQNSVLTNASVTVLQHLRRYWAACHL